MDTVMYYLASMLIGRSRCFAGDVAIRYQYGFPFMSQNTAISLNPHRIYVGGKFICMIPYT